VSCQCVEVCDNIANSPENGGCVGGSDYQDCLCSQYYVDVPPVSVFPRNLPSPISITIPLKTKIQCVECCLSAGNTIGAEDYTFYLETCPDGPGVIATLFPETLAATSYVPAATTTAESRGITTTSSAAGGTATATATGTTTATETASRGTATAASGAQRVSNGACVMGILAIAMWVML
jgi:hypothetical protein